MLLQNVCLKDLLIFSVVGILIPERKKSVQKEINAKEN